MDLASHDNSGLAFSDEIVRLRDSMGGEQLAGARLSIK